ncbi:MAG TPA: aldehyde ferredoxin oxidoreductase C-terminal domain-containing protein [Desulfomonilia bacterium]|nr:aldehyde ferredoxin oxidoreductase C-terminal domain-containing protein [Desulfomonilia bacterium]
MGKGFGHTCLFIDMTSRRTHREVLDSEISEAFLGGRGMGTYFLGLEPGLTALDPAAPLIFATGALTGSHIPSSGRMMISAFSPLTNTVCSCSVGGGFALEMKRSLIDIIHITGRSDKQTNIFIENDSISFEDSPWDRETPLSRIFEDLSPSGGSAAAVGEAAYRGCLYASIMVDNSFASGRGGLGLVMASKNIRALVVRGNAHVRATPFDPEAEEKARTDIIRLFDASPALMGRSGIHAYGTSALVDLMASRHMMPTANFRRTFFEGSTAFSGPAIRSEETPRHYACRGCPIACKQKSAREIPEFETLSHFGALNENNDLKSIIEANLICNETGMDTISAASTIACLAEIKGARYTGDALVEKVRSIMGTGSEAELLRKGSAILARELGAPGKSMSVKSLELPAYDPRGAYGMALAYATSTRGGCHLRAYPIAHEILGKPVKTDRFSFSGKARIIKIAEDTNTVVDSIGACKFAFLAASLEEYAKGFAAVTGLAYDTQDLLRIGDNIYTLERHINSIRGFTRKDDMLPERFYTEPGTGGPGIEIPPLDKGQFFSALERYYRIRGCNPDGTIAETRIKGLLLCRTR